MQNPKLAGVLFVAATLAACTDPLTRPTEVETEPGSRPLPPAAVQLRGAEGYAVRGELRTGWIIGRGGTPIQVTYEIQDGLAIWQGDIVLAPAHRIARTRAELSVQGGVRLPELISPTGAVIDGAGFRWPGGVVPYTIHADLTNTARVTNAIPMVEQTTPGVTLVPRNGEADYVTFRPASGCSSPIGRQGGQQFINLGDGCTTGNTAHEILHALGMFHEHSRCDRDEFVEVMLDQVEDDAKHNFDKECDGATDLFAYDEGSIMHYGTHFFAIGNEPTLVSKRGLNHLMGQRDALGPTDIQTIEALYGHFNIAPVAMIGDLADSYPEGSPVPFDGTGSSDADDDDAILTYAWTFGDGTCAGAAPPAKCSSPTPSHSYADDGVYTVTLVVSDGFLDDETSVDVTVLNVAPIVAALADVDLTSGETFHFSGSFSDPGVVDFPWEWEIDWGFGTPASGSTYDQSAAIEASVQVCTAGTYDVVLSVTDKDGDTGTGGLTLTVPYLAVVLDIMPGGSRNPIRLRQQGLLPIAILSTATFDATSIDPASVTLGDEAGTDTPVGKQNNGSYRARQEDVNGDGLLDLVVMFEVPALVANGDLTAATTELVLLGFLADACTNFRGAGPIVVVP